MQVKRWLLPPRYPEAAELARQVPVAVPAARVLWHRGIRDVATARAFLSAELDQLHDPFLMKGMHAAVDRLWRAIRRRERILIYGDYDADGATAVVILKKAIELAGGTAEYVVPDRFAHGYGVHSEFIEQAARRGVSLLVSVDTGIRAASALERAAELGLDVIVADHHLPGQQLPRALAILNPRQPGCPYPEKNLCGTGIVFKLIHGLLVRCGWSGKKLEALLDSFLKMVAIATVADVVPLVGENRVFVQRGLAALESVKNPGLRALLEAAGIRSGREVAAHEVAFRIAPRINAAGRMASAVQAIELFLTDDEDQARDLAERLNQWNAERQRAEERILDEIERRWASEPALSERRSLVFAGEGWHLGVVGIVASRLVERFYRPCFVLGIEPDTGLVRGSGRSIRGLHLLAALEDMSDLFERYGGHAQAAGVTLRRERLEEFERRLEQYCRERLDLTELQPVLEVDSFLDLEELDEGAFTDLLRLGPFGYGNPPPVFVIENACLVGEPRRLGESHLQLWLKQGTRQIAVRGWKLADREEELRSLGYFSAAISIEANPEGPARGYAPWTVNLLDFQPAR